MTATATIPAGDPTFHFRYNGQDVYTPLPRQLDFHHTLAKYPLYGGAAGGGKSKCLRWHLYMYALAVPGLKGLLLRRQLKDLEESHETEIPGELASMGLAHCWRASDHKIVFPNGSTIKLDHCQFEKDYKNFLSAAYDIIAFDELVTFTELQYQMISSRCRTIIPGFSPQVIAATNPGGPESAWVRRLWIDRNPDRGQYPEYDPAQYVYIPAQLHDNHHLNREAYIAELKRLPAELRRAYLDGDWDVFIGQFFSEFRRSLHVGDFHTPSAPHIRFCGMDWGYAKPGVCLWGVVTGDGQLLIEDEYVFNGPTNKKEIAAKVATSIVQRNRRRGVTVRAYYADPSMDLHHGAGKGESIFETFKRHKVPLSKAKNARVPGWQRVRAWLDTMPGVDESRPFIRIHPRCQYLIRTLPSLVMDTGHPEDLDTTGDDHAADALRYLVMGRPAPVLASAAVSYAPGTAGAIRQAIARSQAQQRVVLGRRLVKRSTSHAA